MNKKLIISVLVLGLMLLSVPVVLAAGDKSANPEIAQLQQQIHDLQKQLVQKYVDNGQITANQAKDIEQRMDQQFSNAQANGFQPGTGCLGAGQGCFGGGCGGYGRGYGNAPNAATPQSFNNL